MTGFTEVIIVEPIYQTEKGRIYYDDTTDQIVVQSNTGVLVKSQDGTDIQLDPSNAVNFTTYQFPKDDGLYRQVLSTDGAGQLSFIALAEALDFNLGDLANVTIVNPSEGQTITYDATNQEWINSTLTFAASFTDLTDTPADYTGAAGQVVTVNNTEDGLIFTTPTTGNVDSVFGRSGIVVATDGDYNTDQVTNSSTVTGATTSDALETLDNELDFKADKITLATDGNLVSVDTTGNIEDSGFAPSDFATAASGNLANTAIQPLDNVSELTNDAGYITTAPVTSVDGRVGVVTLGDLYATAAQGALADTALQNIDNESIGDLSDVDLTGIVSTNTLVWDGTKFVPGAGGGGGAVDSVFGRTGVVTAQSDDYDITQIGSVDTTGIVSNDTLVWNGSTFVPGIATGGQYVYESGRVLSNITVLDAYAQVWNWVSTDMQVTTTLSNNAVNIYRKNGSKWELEFTSSTITASSTPVVSADGSTVVCGNSTNFYTFEYSGTWTETSVTTASMSLPANYFYNISEDGSMLLTIDSDGSNTASHIRFGPTWTNRQVVAAGEYSFAPFIKNNFVTQVNASTLVSTSYEYVANAWVPVQSFSTAVPYYYQSVVLDGTNGKRVAYLKGSGTGTKVTIEDHTSGTVVVYSADLLVPTYSSANIQASADFTKIFVTNSANSLVAVYDNSGTELTLSTTFTNGTSTYTGPMVVTDTGTAVMCLMNTSVFSAIEFDARPPSVAITPAVEWVDVLSKPTEFDPTSGSPYYATTAQGALADTALQPATVLDGGVY